MPTYEYRCAAGHEFEVVQKMSDEALSRCPKCGAEAERLLSAGAGLLFKGEGFYITDYRSDSYRKAAKAETTGGDASKSESSTKSDSTKSDSAKSGSSSSEAGGSGGKGSPSKKRGSAGSGD